MFCLPLAFELVLLLIAGGCCGLFCVEAGVEVASASSRSILSLRICLIWASHISWSCNESYFSSIFSTSTSLRALAYKQKKNSIIVSSKFDLLTSQTPFMTFFLIWQNRKLIVFVGRAC